MKGLYALVGMKHRGTEAAVAALPAGEPLRLVREPLNPHDRNAVQVWARGQHVGFIKAAQVRPLAMAMDNKPVEEFAAVLRVTPDRWPMVEVEE